MKAKPPALLDDSYIPVYWEQMEPEQGYFEFSIVDAVVSGAQPFRGQYT
jgi:hypothetical protein